MQIDFHHAVTYVTARCAGFEHDKADIIATAAQYVDDATKSGTIEFSNHALYARIASAHRMIDLRNGKERANHMTWLPFHFLPGNNGVDDVIQPGVSFLSQLVCRPNSPVAKKMVDIAISKKGSVPYDLHLLGVTMHVYADTWAHQGFAGLESAEVNEVEDALNVHEGISLVNWLKGVINDVGDDILPALGHARANILPDLPYLQWKYRNGAGETIERNNTVDFIEAAQELCKAMQKYLGKSPVGLGVNDENAIRDLFQNLKSDEEAVRHAGWLKAIAAGKFSFGLATVSYDKAAWKTAALGDQDREGKNTFHQAFMTSDWKMFHDAIQDHRFTVLHRILPEFGLCAA